MNTSLLACLTRPVPTLLSRRALAGVVGLGSLGQPFDVDAKKRK